VESRLPSRSLRRNSSLSYSVIDYLHIPVSLPDARGCAEILTVHAYTSAVINPTAKFSVLSVHAVKQSAGQITETQKMPKLLHINYQSINQSIPYSLPRSVSWCLAEGYWKRRSAPPHGPMWLGKDFTFFTNQSIKFIRHTHIVSIKP